MAPAGETTKWASGRSTAIRCGLVGLIAAILGGLVAPSQASAATGGIMVGVFPEFPTRVEIGSTNVAASVMVINGSIGAEAAGSLTVTELTLVPSCGNFSPTCAGGADPGVMQLPATGTGAAPTNCAGKSFDITVVDPATGRVRFTPSDGSALLLGPTAMENDLDSCRILFTVLLAKLPTIDSYPSLAEPQTNQVGFVSVRHANGNTGTDQGEDVTTIVAGTRYARWVDRAYRDLLGRPPSNAESNSWVSALTTGQQTRASVAKLTTDSTEYRRYKIGQAFISYLGRPATEAELSAFVNALGNCCGFQFWESFIVASDEFFALSGSTLLGYVEALYRVVMGKAPDLDVAGVLYFLDLLTRGAGTRASVAVTISYHPITHDRLAATAVQQLLRRPATPAEVTAWSDQLDGGLRLEYLSANLVASDEYLSQV